MTLAPAIRWRPTLGALILLLSVALLQGPTLLAAAWGNVGYVGLAAEGLETGTSRPGAEQALLHAQALAPTQRAGFARGLGWFYMRQGRQDEAERSLRQAWALNPQDSLAGFFLGQVLWEVGERGEALEVWRRAGVAAYFLTQGKELQAAGRWEEAEGVLRLAVELAPQSWEAHLELGEVLLRNRKVEQALQAFRQALALCPQDEELEVYLWLGHAYRAAKDRDKALWAYREAYARAPRDTYLPYYAYYVGLTLLELGRLDEAEAFLQGSVPAAPHAPNHYLLARIYLQREDWARAAEELERAVALAPSALWYYEALGDVYRKQGRTEAALEAYEAAFCLAAPGSKERERIAKKVEALGTAVVCEGE